MDDYISFCETLWRGWLDEGPYPPLAVSSLVRKVFDLEAAPEPYLSFGDTAEPLIFFTTNPGGIMCHQQRIDVRAGRGPLRKEDNYAENALRLAPFYKRELAGQAAGRRIKNLDRLCRSLPYTGIMQVEAFPFHSGSLFKNAKNALLQEATHNKCGLLGQYVRHLEKFLEGRSVLSLQAVSCRDSLTHQTPGASRWLGWITQIAGLNLENAAFVELLKKNSKVTAAAYISEGSCRKALVLMMGSNNLPSEEGLGILREELQKYWK